MRLKLVPHSRERAAGSTASGCVRLVRERQDRFAQRSQLNPDRLTPHGARVCASKTSEHRQGFVFDQRHVGALRLDQCKRLPFPLLRRSGPLLAATDVVLLRSKHAHTLAREAALLVVTRPRVAKSLLQGRDELDEISKEARETRLASVGLLELAGARLKGPTES